MEESGDSEQVASIEKSLKRFIDMENELLIQREVLREMGRDLVGNKEIASLTEEYETQLQRKMQDYGSRSDVEKYHNHPKYQSFKTSVWEVNKNGPHPFAEPADENAELVLEAVTRKPICPITRQIFKIPMTAKECGHSFEKAAIEELFEQAEDKRAGEIECPQSGCRKLIRKANLKENKDLRRQAKHFANTQREQQEMKEDEMDVVE
ncbi:hypothetical protein HDU93_002613 [Gonapodya sp. JEL0774]|nr:hypothetical protein HDU93_002613 [Gonapodya sp. JEL0774]